MGSCSQNSLKVPGKHTGFCCIYLFKENGRTSFEAVLLPLWPFPFSVTSEIWLQGYHFHLLCKWWCSMHALWLPRKLDTSFLPSSSSTALPCVFDMNVSVTCFCPPCLLRSQRTNVNASLISSVVSDPPGNILSVRKSSLMKLRAAQRQTTLVPYVSRERHEMLGLWGLESPHLQRGWQPLVSLVVHVWVLLQGLLDMAFYAECSLMSASPPGCLAAQLKAVHIVAAKMRIECSHHPRPTLSLSSSLLFVLMVGLAGWREALR